MNKQELIKQNNEILEAEELNNFVKVLETGINVWNEDANLIKQKLLKIDLVAQEIKKNLVFGSDYGNIPGIAKPVLFKDGAQKIALAYGLRVFYKEIEKNITDFDLPIYFLYQAELWDNQNRVISQGLGYASTAEKKFTRSGQHPLTEANTMLKMAMKRALVSAITNIGNLSKIFTQDLDDNLTNSEILDKQKLGKNDCLKLYSVFYRFLNPNYQLLKKDSEELNNFKALAKTKIPEILKKAGISNAFMDFTIGDKTKFLKYVEENTNN